MKENKGFSMVEMIIVIAIMAILAATLAPMLIKYINKARLSSDIDVGKAIANAIMNNIADDGDFDGHAQPHDNPPQKVNQMDDATFKSAVFESLNSTSGSIYGKSKKAADGTLFNDREFYYTLNTTKNKVEVYYGGTVDDYMIYPAIGSKLMDR